MQVKPFGTAPSAWRMCIIGLILVGLLPCAAAAEKAITGVDVANKPDRVVITVQANSALTMTPLVSTKGAYVGFQFPCKLVAKGRLVGIHSSRIHNVRYSNFKNNPPTTRIVVNTSGHVDYSTNWSNDKTRLEISVWKNGAPKAQPAVKAEPKPAAALKPAAVPAVTSAVKNQTQTAAKPPTSAPVTVQPVQVAAVAAVDHTPKGSDPGDAVEPEVAAAPAASPAKVARMSPAIVSPAPSTKKVSLNFLGADIQDVLKALSVQSGENIVASKDVSGPVTVSLSNVTVEQALDYVARLSGYGYAKEENTYLVGTKDSLRSISEQPAGATKVEVVALNHAEVSDAIALLKSQYPEVQATAGSQSGKSDKEKTSRGGLLVLSGTEKQVADAKTLIAQVDDSVRELIGGTRTEVYRVKYVSVQEMMNTLSALLPDVQIALAPSEGFDLYAPEAVKMSGEAAGGSTVTHAKIEKSADEVGFVQSLIMTGPDASVQRALEMAAKLDVKSPQIRIDAKVTSLTESGEKKLGLSWDWSPFAWAEGFTDFDKTTDQLPSPENNKNVRIARKQWLRQPFSFAATLDALIKEGEGELLAAPSMITLEGKPGIFFVGDEVRYIVLVQQTPQGQNVLTETANVGVQLRVAGDVSPDGYITLNLHPEVSVLQLEKDTATGITLPIITRRFTDHVVRVKSGETLVIGGLIRDEELDILSKVPVLGDLPILGKLFRHKQKTKNHSEVVMFITATILED